MSTRSRLRFLLTFAIAGTLAAAAHGQTLVHHYAGGEDDGSVSSGHAVTTTIDSGLTGTNLTSMGNAVIYASITSGSGSSLSYNFDGDSYLASSAPDAALGNTDSFFMELHFTTFDTATTSALLYNGNTFSSGIGLYLYGGQLSILRGGVALTQIAPVAADTWNYAAVVYDHGSGSVYLNGTSYAIDLSGGFGSIDNGALSIGGSDSGADLFSGLIDDVRISSFASGTFTPSMLSSSAVPEPATYAAFFGLAALGATVGLRRRQSQRA